MTLTVAVIGATGFIGSHLVPHLTKAGHRVIAVSRDGRRRTGWSEQVETRSGDVATGAGLDEALVGSEAVVHLVAIPRETKGLRFEDINVRGTRRVVEAAERAGIRRFVHLSAIGVVGDPKLRFLDSKWHGEQAARESSLNWVVLRPSLMFGEGDGFFNIVKTTLRNLLTYQSAGCYPATSPTLNARSERRYRSSAASTLPKSSSLRAPSGRQPTAS